MTIDQLSGRAALQWGRRIIPIVGRFCGCGHNHLAKYRVVNERYEAYGPSSQCSGCDCTDFRRRVGA